MINPLVRLIKSGVLVERTVINTGCVSLRRYSENADEAQEIRQMTYHGGNPAADVRPRRASDAGTF